MSVINFLYVCVLAAFSSCAADSPLIGILTQETCTVAKYFPDEKFQSFIAASYVKFLESSGAKVIPVWIGRDEQYYRWIVNSTNGLLFPGGGTYFNEPKGYGEAATHLYRYATNANDAGVHYPILGICLGMQVFPFAAINGRENDTRVNCDSRRVALPLDFTPGFSTGKLYSKASETILDIFRTKNVTYNFHRYCLTEDSLIHNGLLDDWRILSHNIDTNGFKFISSMEHKHYPFYGTQYHPEKNPFEFAKGRGVPKSPEAIEISQYIGNFFVDECRKNNQTLNGVKEEDVIIYKFCPYYVGHIAGSSYEQLYMFKTEQVDEEVELLK